MGHQLDTNLLTLREKTISAILARQDDSFRWGYNEKQARERPEYLYYSPNFKSTLWTLVCLADLKAPLDLPQINASIRFIANHFYDPEHGIYMLPNMSHFPIPCLNGNMLYLQHYFSVSYPQTIESIFSFFAEYQRFDDGDFRTPKSYPYCSNTSCYGSHSCYWAVIKLLKGISFLAKDQRTTAVQNLADNCIEFILHHEVCFSSHNKDRFLREEISRLTFPNFYKSDFLEILWLLKREAVHDPRMTRALALLRSKMKDNGAWELEKSMNTIISIGQIQRPNFFITERAIEVLDFYGH